MNELSPESARAAWEGAPLYAGLAPHTVLCHLHEPDMSLRRRTAVLFCPPFGWDEMTSYRARRTWAQCLARAGYPAVRFDLPTTGDSAGGAREPQRVDLWIDATTQMVAWARERAGADRLAVIGLGLGGLLAWQAIADGADVQDLLLWGVPANGRALLREHRAFARLIAVGYAREHQRTSSSDEEDEDDELTGYVLTAETAAALAAFKPDARPPAQPLNRVMLLGRDDLAVPPGQEEFFRENALELQVEGTEDFDALYASPQDARTPLATIERSIAWLHEGESSDAWDPSGSSVRDSHIASAVVDLADQASVEFEHQGKRVREDAIEFAVAGYRISGILTSPVDGPPPEATALLLSAGALRRTGLSRVWVEVARDWAGRGVCSLRFDQPGIGDSSGDERGLVSNAALYEPRATQIVLAAMDWLAAQGLPERYVTVGSCSGAYGALHAALADARVVAVMTINLYAFAWSDRLVAERDTELALSALRSRLWHRLLRGDITADELRAKLKSVSPRRLRGRLAASAEREEQGHADQAFDTLRDRGTDALFLVSDDQPILRQLSRYGSVAQQERWPNVTVDRLPSPDNLFRALPLQHHVHASVDRALDRVVGSEVEPGVPLTP